MTIISKCERQFISDCIIKRQKRIDGREFTQVRTLEIVFGKERGCCMVLQGNTRVFVQVSYEVTAPKKSTPNEGILHINFELSHMSAPDAKSFSRTSEEFIEVQRSLERCIRDSKCVDLESLCIVSASKVWTVRVDVRALSDDGNVTECASIAVISALAHSRRPQVTVAGGDGAVHSDKDKDSVALNLRHMPISINLALFDGGRYILLDPNEMEEKVCDGCYVMGLNAHQEICYVHRRGILLLKEEVIQRIEDVAIKHAQEVTQLIRSALDDDAYKRATQAPIGFINLIQTGTILGAKRQMAEISLETVQNMPSENDPEVSERTENDSNMDNDEIQNLGDEKIIGDTSKIRSKAKERALHILQESETLVFEGGRSKWGGDTDDEASEEEEMTEIKPNISAVKERLSSDSEEETVYINKEQLDKKSSDKRGWFIKDPFA